MSASFARRGNHAQVQQHDAIADHESNGRGRGDIPRDEGERGADAMRDNTHQLTNELKLGKRSHSSGFHVRSRPAP